MNLTKKEKLSEIMHFTLFKIVYDLVYVYFTTIRFEYIQSILEFNVYHYTINWIVFLLFIVLSTFLLKKNSMAFVFKCIVIFSTIPTISLFGLKNIEVRAFMSVVGYWITLLLFFSLLQRVRLTKSKKTDNNKNQISLKYVNYIFYVSFIITLVLWGWLGNFNVVTSFSSASDSRMALRGISLPSIVRYIMSWTGNAFLPFCFAIYLSKKRKWRAIMTFFAGVLLFSINGMKTWLVIYPMIWFVFFTLKTNHNLTKVTNRIALISSIFGLAGLVLFLVYGESTIGALYHRIFSVPAEINYNFYTFISRNEPLLLRESIFRFISDSPYDGRFTFLIGEIFTGNSAANANNGMFGDAYSNFKTFGLIIYPLLLSLVFKILTNIFKDEDIAVSTNILLILVWSLINTSFFTWLITGGAFIYWIIVFVGRLNTLNTKYKKSNKVIFQKENNSLYQ